MTGPWSAKKLGSPRAWFFMMGWMAWRISDPCEEKFSCSSSSNEQSSLLGCCLKSGGTTSHSIMGSLLAPALNSRSSSRPQQQEWPICIRTFFFGPPDLSKQARESVENKLGLISEEKITFSYCLEALWPGPHTTTYTISDVFITLWTLTFCNNVPASLLMWRKIWLACGHLYSSANKSCQQWPRTRMND